MAAALPSFLDSMKCPICLDYAEAAVETQCCGQVYCEKCVNDLKTCECPSCRNSVLRTNALRCVRRMIADLPVACPNSCGEHVTRETLEKHKDMCPMKNYECPIKKCDFSGILYHVIDHAASQHGKAVFSALQLYGAEKVDQKSQTEKVDMYHCPMDNCLHDAEMTRNALKEHLLKCHVLEQDDLFCAETAYRCPFVDCAMYKGRMPSAVLKDHLTYHHMKAMDDFYCAEVAFRCPFDNCSQRRRMTKQALRDHLLTFHCRTHDDFHQEDLAFRCPFDNCNVTGRMGKQAFKTHLFEVHAKLQDDFHQPELGYRCPFPNCQKGRMGQLALREHIIQSHARVPEWFNQIFRKQLPIRIHNSEGRNATMERNGKFYCGARNGSYTTGKKFGTADRIACTYKNRLNCRSCMNLDVTLRNISGNCCWLVNGAGRVAVPMVCTHSEKRRKRQDVCTFKAGCGSGRKFRCDEQVDDGYGTSECSFHNPCEACGKLNYVYTVVDDNNNREDVDYYRNTGLV